MRLDPSSQLPNRTIGKKVNKNIRELKTMGYNRIIWLARAVEKTKLPLDFKCPAS